MRFRFQLIGGVFTAVLMAGATAIAQPQFAIGFEATDTPVGYSTGLLPLSDPPTSAPTTTTWAGGTHIPRVQTAAEIAAELTAAGLNPANAVNSGDQALMVVFDPDDPETQGGFDADPTTEQGGGGFVRTLVEGLEAEQKVSYKFSARGLTPGSTGSTIGPNQNNVFVGVMDNSEKRAAALRFGYNSTTLERNIEYFSAGSWTPSGVFWTGDDWYDIEFDLDYAAKTQMVYIDGALVTPSPVPFYDSTSAFAARPFISRGTNQAGLLLDDMSLEAITGSLLGDYDGSGVVDGDDYAVWAGAYGMTANPVGSGADGNGDGVIDAADYTVWRDNVTPTSGALAVPEPATQAALAVAVLGLLARRRDAKSVR